MQTEWAQGEFLISTDPRKLDLDLIHGFMESAYWCENIPRGTVGASIANSLTFGIYREDEQVGFARVITDYATIAYLGDLFIVEAYRGLGLSKWLMNVIVSHPRLQGLRRWILATLYAHGLYEQFGFKKLNAPERWMERWDPDVYLES